MTIIYLLITNTIAHIISFVQLRKARSPNTTGVFVFIFVNAILPEKGIKSRTHWYGYVYLCMRPFNGLLKKSKHVITTMNFGKEYP